MKGVGVVWLYPEEVEVAWFYLEGVANILSQCRMATCSKWSIACDTDRHHKNLRGKYLCYDVTTNEGVVRKFVITKE